VSSADSMVLFYVLQFCNKYQWSCDEAFRDWYEAQILFLSSVTIASLRYIMARRSPQGLKAAALMRLGAYERGSLLVAKDVKKIQSLVRGNKVAR